VLSTSPQASDELVVFRRSGIRQRPARANELRSLSLSRRLRPAPLYAGV